MTRPDGPRLVLGVGNLLLRDEGVGVQVIQALERLPEGTLQPDVRLVDGGTLGLDLLPLIDEAAAVVLVDAVNLRREPGAVAVIRGEALGAALAGHVSPHQVGVGDLIGAARLAGIIPPFVSLVAIQPASIEIGLELTPAVEAAVPMAVDAVIAELAAIAAGGIDPSPSASPSAVTA